MWVTSFFSCLQLLALCPLPCLYVLLQDHLHDQPWCQTAAPSKDKFGEALKQHKSLDFFDYVTYDAFQVHPHLFESQAV
jgi:hypothetical protein